MYNAKQKQSYLDSIRDKINAIAVFKRIELVEKRYNKDVCDFVPEEIEDLILSIRTKSTAYMKIVIKVLKNYTEFAIRKNFRNIDNINFFAVFDGFSAIELDTSLDGDLKQFRYINIYELEDRMRELDSPIDHLLMYLLWSGFGGKELCEIRFLRVSDFNHKDKTVNIRDIDDNIVGSLPCIDKVFECANIVKDIDVYCPDISSRTRKKLNMKTKVIFKPVLRSNAHSSLTIHAIYDRYERICKDIGTSKMFTPINSFKLSSTVNLAQIINNRMNIDEKRLYRILASFYYNKKIPCGFDIKNRIYANVSEDIDISKISTDIIIMYLNRLDLVLNMYTDDNMRYCILSILSVLEGIILSRHISGIIFN